MFVKNDIMASKNTSEKYLINGSTIISVCQYENEDFSPNVAVHLGTFFDPVRK